MLRVEHAITLTVRFLAALDAGAVEAAKDLRRRRDELLAALGPTEDQAFAAWALGGLFYEEWIGGPERVGRRPQ